MDLSLSVLGDSVIQDFGQPEEMLESPHRPTHSSHKSVCCHGNASSSDSLELLENFKEQLLCYL